jgi:ribonuclease inhibitor
MEHIIDLSPITTAKDLHILLAQKLSLPDWFGHNLDALYDCLTDLPEPTHLILQNWKESASFASGFAGVFDDAQADNPDFTVEYQ